MHNKLMSLKTRKICSEKSFSIYDIYDKINHARCKTSAVLAGMFIFANTVTFAAPYTVDVKIYDNDSVVEVVSVPSTVGEVLESKNIGLGMYDIVHPDVDTYFNNSQVIVIERVKKVIVNDAGVTTEYFTTKDTVGEFLEDKGIELGFYDSLDVSIDAQLQENTNLSVTRVVKTTVTVDSPIPYRTVTQESAAWEEGSSMVVRKGKNGVLTKKYDVYLTNGVETERVEISSEVTAEPVDKQVLVGTGKKAADIVRTEGAPSNYSAVLTCTATAYDLSFQSCGKRPGDKGYGITATGTHAKYGTVAVDPKVIPLGSKLYIETTDGSFVYGYATAEDTGGAIKGNKVDLFFPSYNDCMQFGRRSVRVYILN